MKKILFSLATLLLISAVTFAQPGKDAFKKAKKDYFKALSSDGDNKIKNFESAKGHIETTITNIGDFDKKGKTKVYVKAGEIYNELASIDRTQLLLNPNASIKEVQYPEAPGKAFNALKMAIESAGDDKKLKRDKSDAVTGLMVTFGDLDQVARKYYMNKEYAKAANLFLSNLEIRDLLLKHGGKDRKILATDKEYHEYLYSVGLAAYNGKMNDKAIEVFTILKDTDSPGAATAYEVLYALTSETDKEGALTLLTEGRAKFPADEGLRVKEINYYLNAGKLDALVGKIQDAIDATPDNISLYLTMGHVYDALFQRELEAGNDDKATAHFDNALKFYNDAISKDAKNHAALYNIGALYYNKAATMTKELIALEGDYSKAGLKKYDEKKKEVFSTFDEALPFFEKAEAIDPNDIGTVTALKEIFAKKDDLEKYNEFKSRMETINGGGKVETSFFKG